MSARRRAGMAAMAGLAWVFAALPGSAAPAEPPAGAAPGGATALIAPDLLAQAEEAARTGEPLDVVVAFAAAPDLDVLAGDQEAVVAGLQAAAAGSRTAFEARLAEGGTFAGATVLNSLWIDNSVLVRLPAAEAAAQVSALARAPDVAWIAPNAEVRAAEATTTAAGTQRTPDAVVDRTWGVDRIGAHRVWDELEVDGSGVRVATLDTGVDIGHPDLAGRMAVDDQAEPSDETHPGGWMEFDSYGQRVRSAPHDTTGHGTHVSGTIHGGDESGVAVGVAPGAQLMHGLILPGGTGTLYQLMAGMQWAIDPVDVHGEPAGEPADVVNMSLSQVGFHPAMIAPTRAIRAAGIVPVFSIGDGCPPGLTSNPANVYEAVAVGTTDGTDAVDPSSCGGVVDRSNWPNAPATWPDSYVKPDLTAPGTDVYSTLPGGGYGHLSGTSAATPHVAGTVALMLSARPGLVVDDVQRVLAQTAIFDARHGYERPNERYGQGRVDALRAVSEVALSSGLTGTVTDAVTGGPVEGATVIVTGDDSGRTTRTDEAGRYTLLLEPGTYELTAGGFGYGDAARTAVVRADAVTTADAALTPSPSGSVAGTVTYADTGSPVPGVDVALAGTPLTAVTGSDGRYRFDGVPAGDWAVTAHSATLPDPDPLPVTVAAGATAALDVELRAPLPTVATLGDDIGHLRGFLAGQDIEAVPITWERAGGDLSGFGTVVVSYAAGVTEGELTALLDAADASGTGIVFLDTWHWDPFGISLLVDYLGNPAARYEDGGIAVEGDLYYEVLADHPIFAGWEVGDRILIDELSLNRFHAWFEGYAGDDREVIGTIGRTDTGTVGDAVAVQQRPTNRHVLLSAHGTTTSNHPGTWTDDAGTVFTNALAWAGPVPDPALPRVVEWNLRVDEAVTTAGGEVVVSADVTNVGGSPVTHTAELVVHGAVAATAEVTLEPGETRTVSWPLRRDEARVYPVRVGEEAATFRVRPPRVELTTLPGATVELVDPSGEWLMPLGGTDAAGRLTFEPPVAGDHVVVVRDAEHLLVEPVTVTGDEALDLRPDVAGLAAVDLRLDSIGGGHTAVSYLRHELTGALGFPFPAGTVLVTPGRYDVQHVHTVRAFEHDSWAVSAVAPLPAATAGATSTVSFGGPAVAAATATVAGTQLTIDWSVTDAHGLVFVSMGEPGPRRAPAGATVLEDVTGLLTGAGARETEVVIRLFGPSGAQLHGGGVGWGEGTLTRDLTSYADPVPAGTYRVTLTAETGGYPPGELVATARARVRP
ncbi:S8 family serine peptidase [Jiangella asiatica]|uniref:alpha-amylase n=1 Tax=Jiangella asiatica TaxID=2530372 RepID=A0A4R5CRN5_9ACTN|nr:S8 family serine peptidase [Jiangella asiatica]TDE01491.1 hypothetical protein E1269_23210 [Jiangella asiatica]